MYTGARRGWLRYIEFMIADLFCIELAFILGFVLRHGMLNPFGTLIYSRMGIALLMGQIIVGFLNESYRNIFQRGYLGELKAVFLHSTYCLTFIFIYMFVMQMTGSYSRIVLVSTWFYSIVFIYMERICCKKLMDRWMIRHGEIRSVMLISQKSTVKNCLEVLEAHRYVAYKITSIVLIGKDAVGKEIKGIPVVATEHNITEYLKNNIVDEAFLNLYEDTDLIEDLTGQFLEAGVTVHRVLAKLTETSIKERVVENFGGFVVVSTSLKLATPQQVLVKRIIDFFGSLFGLLIMVIAFVIFAPIIFIQSPGSVFFSQIRVGKGGRRFKVYKFRTMYKDAEERKKDLMSQNEMQGLMFKIKDDPRIIPIGRFMRKMSIDELPQMWNILKGDMSLVGTRPPTIDEWSQYKLKDLKRLSIKPGLTGLWQVSGRSGITDFEEVVALDTKYITEWSIGLDIKIMLKTVQVVILQKGSA